MLNNTNNKVVELETGIYKSEIEGPYLRMKWVKIRMNKKLLLWLFVIKTKLMNPLMG